MAASVLAPRGRARALRRKKCAGTPGPEASASAIFRDKSSPAKSAPKLDSLESFAPAVATGILLPLVAPSERHAGLPFIT